MKPFGHCGISLVKRRPNLRPCGCRAKGWARHTVRAGLGEAECVRWRSAAGEGQPALPAAKTLDKLKLELQHERYKSRDPRAVAERRLRCLSPGQPQQAHGVTAAAPLQSRGNPPHRQRRLRPPLLRHGLQLCKDVFQGRVGVGAAPPAAFAEGATRPRVWQKSKLIWHLFDYEFCRKC